MSHKCPRCGQSTDGAWSEGGLRWAICEECMQDRREQEAQWREKEYWELTRKSIAYRDGGKCDF